MRGRTSARLLALGSAAMVALAACAGVSGVQHPRPARHASSTPAERPLPATVAAPLVGLAGGSVPTFQKAINRKVDLNVTYISMDKPVSPHYVAWVEKSAAGAKPVIEILPDRVSISAVAHSSDDVWLRSLAKEITEPVVLSFAPEADGSWYSWSGHPGIYAKAWRHVVSVVGHKDITWMWQISAHPGARHDMLARYWPGSAVVDWVGLDGYFEFARATFGSIFGKAITDVRKLTTRPILLSETSVGSRAVHVNRDIDQLFQNIHWDHLLGLIWFDRTQHDPPYHLDWNLESRPSALATFRGDSGI